MKFIFFCCWSRFKFSSRFSDIVLAFRIDDLSESIRQAPVCTLPIFSPYCFVRFLKGTIMNIEFNILSSYLNKSMKFIIENTSPVLQNQIGKLNRGKVNRDTQESSLNG